MQRVVAIAPKPYTETVSPHLLDEVQAKIQRTLNLGQFRFFIPR
ncbi:MAG: hypothetical protein AAFX78_12385 [Cyanobacteria bacterium J06638_20]